MNPIAIHAARLVGQLIAPVRDPFSREIASLPDANNTDIIELQPGSTFDLRAAAVRKRIGDSTVKMLAYNGSIPGPTLKVQQGSEVTIHFTNEFDLETTVHWHGLRHDNRFDGVPTGIHHGMQAPLAHGESFTYRLQFPDPGIYWYHPHIREDYTQEHGLYGNIIVAPDDPSYWPPVNRELALFLDDILIEGGKIAPFSKTRPNRTAMGRYGNVMLVNGETDYAVDVAEGEVVRLYLTNASNVRPFNVRIPGAGMKLVGLDLGRVEVEQFVDEVLLAPAERAIVDVHFDAGGKYALEHHSPERIYPLGNVNVSSPRAAANHDATFGELRRSEELAAERDSLELHLTRPPDQVIALVAEMSGMKHHGGHEVEEIEWEDTMQLHNLMTTPKNMFWRIVDQTTGRANHDIHWAFKVGDRVKIRVINDPHSDHPMQHPLHIHGQRFLILRRDGERNENLAWRDTVLIRTGEVVDILLEVTNPGEWMMHCHIAEHLEGGMMSTFRVD